MVTEIMFTGVIKKMYMYHSDKYHGIDWISGSSLIRYVKTFGIWFICEKILDGMEYQHPNSLLKTVPFNPLDGIFRGGVFTGLGRSTLYLVGMCSSYVMLYGEPLHDEQPIRGTCSY